MSDQALFEALDAGLIQSRLSPEAAMQIDRLTVLPEVDSTSSWVKRQPEPGVIIGLAECQTAGRGRRGRSWTAPAGSGILLSVRWPLRAAPEALRLLSLQAGLAVREAVAQTSGLAVRLKWPNDLMLDGKKLGGILVELQSGGRDFAGEQVATTAIIGIGLNVSWPDAEPMPQPLADCRDADPPVTRNGLAAAMLTELSAMLGQFGADPACSIVSRWWQHDMLAGQPVVVQQNDQQFTGRAAGIAADGGFVLDTDDGIKTFYSSEVSIRLAA